MEIKTTKAKGDEAEELVYLYMIGKGFEVFERNFYTRYGEIDLIAIKDKTLHFVEVKSSVSYESAINNVSKTKLQRVIQSAFSFMKQKKLDLDYCIDVAIVVNKKIDYIENVTL